MENYKRLAEHAKMITNYIPYMQANLILGLDADEGPEPIELTTQFVDLAPLIYPYFSLLSAYGRSAPANLEYQKEGRVLNVPFHFLRLRSHRSENTWMERPRKCRRGYTDTVLEDLHHLAAWLPGALCFMIRITTNQRCHSNPNR